MTDTGDRPLVVLVSGVGWDAVKGSERQLAEALSADVDVLWVDHPVSPVTPSRHLGVGTRKRALSTTVDEVTPGITRLRPVVLPLHSRGAVRWTTWPIVRAHIRAYLRRIGRRPVAVLVASFDDVLGRWGDDVVDVLYGTDDWVAAAALMGQPAARLERDERAALDRADLVLAVSPELADRWSGLGVDPMLLPNGCDAEAFESVGTVSPAELPDGFPTAVAGIMGRLTDRIDVALLEAVVDSGVGLLVVGPRDSRWQPERVDRLLRRDAVHDVGAVAFEELPRWLARMHVGLVPYVDSTFNRASFPLKTLEYLAAGLPVVSTGLPAVRRLGVDPADLHIETDAGRYATAVAAFAGRVPEPAAVARRRSFARDHSWSGRAQNLLSLLAAHGAPLPELRIR